MNKLFALGLLLTFCLMEPVTNGAQSGAYTLDQVYGQLDKVSKTFKTIEANIERTEVNVIVPDDKEIKSGKFSYARAGSVPRVMLEFSKPAAQSILIDKDLLQIYDPGLKRVQQMSIAQHRDTVEQIMAIGFGQSSDDMKKQYDVTLAPDEAIDGQKTTVLDLKPLKASGTIKSIRLWIDQQQWVTAQNKFTEPSGSYFITKFNNRKLNGSIPDSKFKLDLPKDVTIVKM